MSLEKEDEHFWKKDRELIEKMRRAAAAEAVRRDLSARSGLEDPQLLDELAALGFTPETLSLLPLVPVIEIAWAESGVTPAEREQLVRLARDRGIAEGSAADRQLSEWLASRPSDRVFARATRLIRAMLDLPDRGAGTPSADDIVSYCEQIAAASGGIMGMRRVSTEERALLSEIAANLKKR